MVSCCSLTDRRWGQKPYEGYRGSGRFMKRARLSILAGPARRLLIYTCANADIAEAGAQVDENGR